MHTMRTPMRRGPAPRTDGPVIVSLTEFTAHHAHDLPRIARDGRRLAGGWWAMAGAIGLTLYVEPLRKRGGSLSIWESEADLRRFVALPRHVAIMRAYRDRIEVRAATWTAGRLDLEAVWAERLERLPAAGATR
jgi:hypothetical protein